MRRLELGDRSLGGVDADVDSGSIHPAASVHLHHPSKMEAGVGGGAQASGSATGLAVEEGRRVGAPVSSAQDGSKWKTWAPTDR
jgi:hypothetical protein